jgi:hypothetical protein
LLTVTVRPPRSFITIFSVEAPRRYADARPAMPAVHAREHAAALEDLRAAQPLAEATRDLDHFAAPRPARAREGRVGRRDAAGVDRGRVDGRQRHMHAREREHPARALDVVGPSWSSHSKPGPASTDWSPRR